MKGWKIALLTAIALIAGIIIGAWLFNDVQPRSFLRFTQCNGTCLSLQEQTGLLAAAIVTHADGVIPNVVLETDKTIAMRHPRPEAPIHYVIIPKKDIKDAGTFSEEDREYLIDAYAVMQELIRQGDLREYNIFTRGPGFQDVNLLHFHLRAEKPE